MLDNTHALIFAAYGAVSSAVAKRLASLGATVHLSGRDLAQVKTLADSIIASGGQATAAEVDACEEGAICDYVKGIAVSHPIDAVFNGIGPRAEQAEYGVPSTTLPYPKFMMSLETILGSQFLTARTVAPYMVEAKSGTIILLSASLSTSFIPMMAGVTAACGGIEALTRVLAAEFGPAGVRVNCVRPTAMPKTRTIRETNAQVQKTIGQSPAEGDPSMPSGVLKREISTDDTAGMVAFLSSPLAEPISGQIFNVCGGQFIG